MKDINCLMVWLQQSESTDYSVQYNAGDADAVGIFLHTHFFECIGLLFFVKHILTAISSAPEFLMVFSPPVAAIASYVIS